MNAEEILAHECDDCDARFATKHALNGHRSWCPAGESDENVADKYGPLVSRLRELTGDDGEWSGTSRELSEGLESPTTAIGQRMRYLFDGDEHHEFCIDRQWTGRAIQWEVRRDE